MMVPHRSQALTFLFVVASVAAWPQTGSDVNTARSTADGLLDKAVEDGKVVGVIAGTSSDGHITWTHATGYADRAAERAFDANTPTRLASISKPMTAVAIMQLVEQGKVDLDATIQTYLPDFPIKKEGPITVRQLLQHTAGIPEYASNSERENMKHYAALSDAVAIFKDRDLTNIPGEAFHYTSYGYVVLGRVIEQVSGEEYGAYMKKRIWDVVGMPNTGIERAADLVASHAALYHITEKGKISEPKRTDLSDRVPGGGIYSCLNDLLKFGDAVMDGTLLEPGTLEQMWKDPGLKTKGNGYGLGWYLYGENPKYGPVYGHNGSQTGATTYLMLLPEQRTTVVVLSNTSGAMQTVTNLTIALFDTAAALRAEP